MMETRRTRSAAERDRDNGGASVAEEQPRKRRSRFDQAPPAAVVPPVAPVPVAPADPAFAAKVAQATEIQKRIQEQVCASLACWYGFTGEISLCFLAMI